MSLASTMDQVNELFNSHRDKLSERNDALEAMVIALKMETIATKMALSTRIEELEVKLALCRAAVGEGVSNVTLSKEDISKPKEFVGIRSTCDVDNFLWRIENYFRTKGIVDDTVKGIVGEYVRKLKEIMFQVSDVIKKEALLAFQNGLKQWSGKDKLGSSKSEERGVCEKDHKEDKYDNGIDNNNGNGKP
ncbi:hypothetical protein CXB51_035215 [Gossypium anomalum]|uniref:Uncharacterized protein n=1 Tax=Gossypium anomalum TaxID=47600 RepID=A0A8J6CMH9_9ROSI|nr:hypothetical protein CXB51_035215 [Gossypium anomalum]